MKTLQYTLLQTLLTLLSLLIWGATYSQIEAKLNWGGIVTDQTFEHGHKMYLYLEDASYRLDLNSLPEVALRKAHSSNFKVTKIESYEMETSPLTNEELQITQPFSSEISSKPKFKIT